MCPYPFVPSPVHGLQSTSGGGPTEVTLPDTAAALARVRELEARVRELEAQLEAAQAEAEAACKAEAARKAAEDAARKVRL